jgi:catechol 2,3-dioxygenase-like lactoylglutathione lyase family enzyme
MLTGLAHTAVCVADVDEAVRWYSEVLGMQVLSPPYLMEGPEIEFDMGELVPSPVSVKAAIVGFAGSDHVLEIIEYPRAAGQPVGRALVDHGPSHIGVVCDDLDATRAQLEAEGVVFLTAGNAAVAGLRTCWFVDPNRIVFIMMEKSKADRPYYRQY